MKTKLLHQLILGVSIFGTGIVTGLIAETLTDSPQRIEQKRTDLSGADGMEVITSTAEYKPGESMEIHFHHGIEAAYVIQGATIETAAGKEPKILATGTNILNLREVKHGGFKVIGEKPLKLFTVHIVDKGKPLYDYSE